MNAFRWMSVVVLVGVSCVVNAGPRSGVVVSHFEPVENLTIGAKVGELSAKPSSVTQLKFDAMGRNFDLELRSNTSLLTGAESVTAKGVDVYRGAIVGNDASWARLVVTDGEASGLIWDGQQMFALEPANDNVAGASTPIAFRLADVFIEAGQLSCGASTAAGSASVAMSKITAELGALARKAPGAVQEITVAAVGDYEFSQAMGGNATAAIVTRLNNVDGIFSQELGVQITVSSVDIFTDPADPFSDVTGASALLGELADYRQSTPAQSSQGLTHLYTGRDLDGSTAGIAFTGVLCSPRFGAGLSEGDAGPTIDSLIAAHEIGHNFGAPHDGEMGSVCEAEPLTFIMAPSVGPGSNGFSDCTKAEVADDIAGAQCVVALPTVDVEISQGSPLATALLSNTQDLTFDVGNNGLNMATNVTADITLPGVLTLNSVAASAGTCTNGAGTVTCTIGDVAGLSNETITVSTTASTVGAGTVDASVSADVDERPINNQLSSAVTVVPAVDLVVATPATSAVQLNSSTTISTTVDNVANLAATGASVTVTMTTGLRADTATWSAGNCTVAAQTVTCQTANLAASSTSSLSVGVTGIAAGRQTITVAAAAAEADLQTGNNTANNTLRVNDPEDEDDGGGALGLPVLLLLSGMVAARRRRRA